MTVNPFSPDFANTKTILATAASQSVTLAPIDVNTASSGQGYNVIRVVNLGPNGIFLRWGTGTVTALTTDMPMLAGTVEVFTKAPSDNVVSAICAATQTATVFVTCGEGQ